jgi:alkylation response protein AidB-like acyl-CoA dehydrogenase
MVLSDTQVAIREAVRAFSQHEIRPRAAEFEGAGAYPRRLFRELAGLGLMGMTAPEKWAGAGADYVSYALALMDVAAADGALSTILSIQNRSGSVIVHEFWLPHIAAYFQARLNSSSRAAMSCWPSVLRDPTTGPSCSSATETISSG